MKISLTLKIEKMFLFRTSRAICAGAIARLTSHPTCGIATVVKEMADRAVRAC